MTVKRQDNGNRVVLTCIGNGLPDDLLMAEMHTVEKTDRKADFFAFGFQFACGVDDFHDAARFRYRITLFSKSPDDSFKISSRRIPSATSNFPQTLRRNFARCAPPSTFSPR